MSRARQIFLARWSEISLWRGTDDRCPFAGLPHHEWLPPSRINSHPLSPRTCSVPDSRLSVSKRATAICLATVLGVPIGGVFSYLSFGCCLAMGSRVIADDAWFSLGSRMLGYGALAAMLPSTMCGFLHPNRPLRMLVTDQCLVTFTFHNKSTTGISDWRQEF